MSYGVIINVLWDVVKGQRKPHWELVTLQTRKACSQPGWKGQVLSWMQY